MSALCVPWVACMLFEGWNQKHSKCYGIKKQIEPFTFIHQIVLMCCCYL